MIGDDRTTSVVALRRRPAPGRCRRWRSRRRPPRPSSGGSSSETNGAVVDGQQRVHGDERPGHAPRRGRRRRRASRCVFSTSTVTLTSAAVPSAHAVDDPDHAVDRARGGAPPGRRRRPSVGRAARCSSPPASTNGVLDRRVGHRAGAWIAVEVDLVLDRLVPRHPLDAVDVDDLGRLEASPSGRPPRRRDAAPGGSGCARRRAASPPGSTTTSVRIDERSEPLGRGVRRRREHAELPAQLVLPGRGPVRVQHVALVEHGVGDGARRRRSGRRRRPVGAAVTRPPPRPPSAAARRPRPRSAGPAAALNRVSASSVSRRSRSQPLFGK